jgi:hypothetical protein
MKKYVEEEFTPEMDFEFAADNRFPLDDEDDDADPPFERFDAPPLCPNCGCKIVLYSPPSPFGRYPQRINGIRMVQPVGLFIQTFEWICPHCKTDRQMLGRFDVWNQIVGLRHDFRNEKFDHHEFLTRELVILENLGTSESISSEIRREMAQFVSDTDRLYQSDEKIQFDNQTQYAFLNELSVGQLRDQFEVYEDDIPEAFTSRRHLIQNWDPDTETSAVKVPIEDLIGQIRVESVGPATAYWYRAKTIRAILRQLS